MAIFNFAEWIVNFIAFSMGVFILSLGLLCLTISIIVIMSWIKRIYKYIVDKIKGE